MKKTLSLTLSTLLFAGVLLAQTGGPDTYGYTWKNNTASGGPVYNWKDIKSVGTQITGFGDDNQKGPFNFNWSFRSYWANYNKVWIGSNGWVAFQNIGNIAAPFPAIPLPSNPNNYLAVLSCDLTFTQTNASAVPGATAWYWTNSVDSLVIQYDSVPYWVNNASGFAGRNTFQVILSGKDSSITYQYKSITAGTPAYGMTSEGLTTGIENSTGQIGLQVQANAFPTSTTAVKFYYPAVVTYQVSDATPEWNQNADNGGFFLVPDGNPKALKTSIFNAGNTALANITTTGEILDIASAQIWDTVASIATLTAGSSQTVVYPKNYVPTTAGTFVYRSTTTVTGDINPSNNITEVEVVVVDTTQTTITLGYTTATAPVAANSWGGNGGQGIYIEPPYYPANITSLDFMVANSGTAGYHLVKVVDDDGAGGSPGTALFSDSVAASAAVAGSYNNVPLPTPLIITSGGFYVGWFENGDTASAIGTDQGLPLSNRNYEIIGGNWATFRNNLSEDLMINVNIEQSLGVSNPDKNSLTLGQNFPNPANDKTTLNYSLQKAGNARVTLYSMLGTQVDAISLGKVPAGEHNLTINTASYPTGIYFYTLTVDGASSTGKMVVSK